MDKFAFMNDLCSGSDYMANFDEAVKSFQNEIDTFYGVIQGIESEVGPGHVKVDPVNFATAPHPPRFSFTLDKKSTYLKDNPSVSFSPYGPVYQIEKGPKGKYILNPFQ